jgi:hypothetical protein
MHGMICLICCVAWGSTVPADHSVSANLAGTLLPLLAGISLKTQELYALVFIMRYLDVFTTFISLCASSDSLKRLCWECLRLCTACAW